MVGRSRRRQTRALYRPRAACARTTRARPCKLRMQMRSLRISPCFLTRLPGAPFSVAPSWPLLCTLCQKNLEKNLGVRPIAVGEVLRRLLGKLLCEAVREEARKCLWPQQAGVNSHALAAGMPALKAAGAPGQGGPNVVGPDHSGSWNNRSQGTSYPRLALSTAARVRRSRAADLPVSIFFGFIF